MSADADASAAALQNTFTNSWASMGGNNPCSPEGTLCTADDKCCSGFCDKRRVPRGACRAARCLCADTPLAAQPARRPRPRRRVVQAFPNFAPASASFFSAAASSSSGEYSVRRFDEIRWRRDVPHREDGESGRGPWQSRFLVQRLRQPGRVPGANTASARLMLVRGRLSCLIWIAERRCSSTTSW